MYGFKQQLPKHSKAVFSESKNSDGQVPRYKIGVVSLYGVLQGSARRGKIEQETDLPIAKTWR